MPLGSPFCKGGVATDDDDCYEDDGIYGGDDIAFCNHDLSQGHHFFKQSGIEGNGGDNKD